MSKAAAILAVVAALLLALDRLALWMEARGWIYWRRRKPEGGGAIGGGAMGGLLTEFQKVVEPEVRHVIEAKEERRVERLNLSADERGGKETDELSG